MACGKHAHAGGRQIGLSSLHTRLERHLEPVLNLPCSVAARGLDDSEGAGNQLSVGIKGSRPRRRQIRMIERVEELEPELRGETFANLVVLDERHIRVLIARGCQRVTPGVSQQRARLAIDCYSRTGKGEAIG